MDLYLQTSRLRLRRFRTGDVERLVELDSDPRVMRYINGGRATSRTEIETDYLPAFLAYYERGSSYGFWAAELTDSADFLGWFHCRPASGDPDDEPELGYRLRHVAWGHGFATEGSRAILDRAFRRSGARRVRAETMAVNVASRAVMEKAGMQLQRSFHQDWPDRIDGEEFGDVEYAITRELWRADASYHTLYPD